MFKVELKFKDLEGCQRFVDVLRQGKNVLEDNARMMKDKDEYIAIMKCYTIAMIQFQGTLEKVEK